MNLHQVVAARKSLPLSQLDLQALAQLRSSAEQRTALANLVDAAVTEHDSEASVLHAVLVAGYVPCGGRQKKRGMRRWPSKWRLPVARQLRAAVDLFGRTSDLAAATRPSRSSRRRARRAKVVSGCLEQPAQSKSSAGLNCAPDNLAEARHPQYRAAPTS